MNRFLARIVAVLLVMPLTVDPTTASALKFIRAASLPLLQFPFTSQALANPVVSIPDHEAPFGFDSLLQSPSPASPAAQSVIANQLLSPEQVDYDEAIRSRYSDPGMVPPAGQPSVKLKDSGGGPRIEPGRGEERHHRISDARFAAEMGFSGKYEIRRNTGFDAQFAEGTSATPGELDAIHHLDWLLRDLGEKSLWETFNEAEPLLRDHPALFDRWTDGVLAEIEMGRFHPTEVVQLTYALSQKMPQTGFFDRFASRYRAMGGYLQVAPKEDWTILRTASPPEWKRQTASRDALGFATDLYADLRFFARHGLGDGRMLVKALYGGAKRIETSSLPEAVTHMREFLEAFITNNNVWEPLLAVFGQGEQELILQNVVRRMRQEAWHDEVQERFAVYQTLLRESNLRENSGNRKAIEIRTQAEAEAIRTWLRDTAHPAMRELRDPYAYLFGSDFSLWRGWHLLGLESQEDWLGYVADLTFMPGTEESLLILLGMMADHSRQHLDADDSFAYHYIWIKLLPWTDEVLRGKYRRTLGFRIRRIFLNSLHINADPRYYFSLGARNDGALGDFSIEHVKDFARDVLTNVSQEVPRAEAILRRVITESSDILNPSGDPPYDFTWADREPQSFATDTGRDVLERYADFVERAGGVKADGTDATIWEFVDGTHDIVKYYRESRQHRMPTPQKELLKMIHLALHEGTFLRSKGGWSGWPDFRNLLGGLSVVVVGVAYSVFLLLHPAIAHTGPHDLSVLQHAA